MISIVSLIFCFNLFAQMPVEWMSAVRLDEKHEFYQDGEVIEKPKGSWQHLFTVIYSTIGLGIKKDCVFYKVPSDELGILKIKSLNMNEKCDEMLFKEGDYTIQALRQLKYSTMGKVHLWFTKQKYKTEEWEFKLKASLKPKPKFQESSASFKSGPFLFLANKVSQTDELLKDGTICHDIGDLCEELKPSLCHQCLNGWSELPNGCEIGPKVCGQQKCGEKNQPACRLGTSSLKPDKRGCRLDPSFAYCRSGLTVECQGEKAFCR